MDSDFKNHFIISPFRDVHRNQALEYELFQRCQPNEEILLFYVNENAVLIGRHQDPARETRPDYLRNRGISLARRVSGGGAVYHDAGNLNIAFIRNESAVSRDRSMEILRDLIDQSLDIRLRIRDGLDLLYRNLKVSGSAFLIRGSRFLHHATLLIDTDREELDSALIPEAAGESPIPSRRSDIANLIDIRSELKVEWVMKRIVETCGYPVISTPDSTGSKDLIGKFGMESWILQGKAPF